MQETGVTVYCIPVYTLIWKFKKVTQRYWNRPRFWCGEHYYKVTTWYRQFMKSYNIYNFTRTFKMSPAHPGNDNIFTPSSLRGWGVKTRRREVVLHLVVLGQPRIHIVYCIQAFSLWENIVLSRIFQFPCTTGNVSVILGWGL